MCCIVCQKKKKTNVAVWEHSRNVEPLTCCLCFLSSLFSQIHSMFHDSVRLWLLYVYICFENRFLITITF